MSKDDTNAGLFSKVVKFVRNPTTSWADLDQQEPDRESSYSKQMLKEMIERKRRNDFVRKREFDMLRKLRRSEVMAGHDPGARPSFFQSSMPSKPDDRATTLKKIDEIEAQMSMQWWKTKHGDPGSSVSSSNFANSQTPPDSVRGGLPSRATPRPGPYDPTEPQPLAPTPNANEPSPAPIEMLPPVDDRLFGGQSAPPPIPVAPARAPMLPPRQWQEQPPPLARAHVPAAPPRPPISGLAPLQAISESPSSTFSASKLFAIDVEEFAHDPELEEAAIRFANGDDEGAEAGLREVLDAQGTRADHDETWLTLFDLYRATGQQDRFEAAAVEFAGRLGRSAPQWMSLPDVVSQMQVPAAKAGEGGAQPAQWTAPSSIGTQTLAAMTAACNRAIPPWRLNWTKVTTIEEAAVEPMTRIFTQWAGEPVQLRFMGGENLQEVLAQATPSGVRSVDPAWWKLRLEVLRVMHRPDEFELVALDYCVTYEVSPPSWERTRCEFKPLQPDGSYVAGHTIIGEAFRDSLSSGVQGFGDSTVAPSTQVAQVSSIELAGEVLGDASDMLDVLEGKLQGADIVVISCGRLIRIDFSAAGSLLNWVSTRQAEGRQVQFVEVNRLVAAFFNVIGISEHARVMARTD